MKVGMVEKKNSVEERRVERGHVFASVCLVHTQKLGWPSFENHNLVGYTYQIALNRKYTDIISQGESLDGQKITQPLPLRRISAVKRA